MLVAARCWYCAAFAVVDIASGVRSHCAESEGVDSACVFVAVVSFAPPLDAAVDGAAKSLALSSPADESAAKLHRCGRSSGSKQLRFGGGA